MPIRKDGNNIVQQTPMTGKRLFDETGAAYDEEFSIIDKQNILSQIRWNVNPTSTDAGSVTLQVDVASGDSTINLSSLGTKSDSFATIQPPAGTSPVADAYNDTLTLTSSDSTLTITGNSTTDTLDFIIASPVAVSKGGTNSTTAAAASRALIPATVTISASDIDWSAGTAFTKTLAANTTFTFSNTQDAQTIVVGLTNTASNYTVTWPTVKWSGGAAPTQTTGAKTDVYTFVKLGSTFYGSAVQNFS